MSSITGGTLTFNYNTFCQRGLNLLDVQDAPTARVNLGIVPGNLGLQALTFGTGLVSGSYNATSAVSINVDTTKVVPYDANGNLGVTSQVRIGVADITRNAGMNGNLVMTNPGSGTFSLNNGTGTIQLASGQAFLLTTGTFATHTTGSGTTIGLSAGASSTSALTVSTGGNAGCTGLTVVGGISADTVSSGSLTSSGSVTASSMTCSGSVTASSMTGSCISDATTGTSSTVCASTKAVAVVQTNANNKLDLTTSTPQTVAGPVTFTSPVSGLVSFSGGTTFSSGATVPTGQTLALDGAVLSGNMTFSGMPTFQVQRTWMVQLRLRSLAGTITNLPLKAYQSGPSSIYVQGNYESYNSAHYAVSLYATDRGSTLSSAVGGPYLITYNPVQALSSTVTFTFSSTSSLPVPAASISTFSTSTATQKVVFLPPNWSMTATLGTGISSNETTTIPVWEIAVAYLL